MEGLSSTGWNKMLAAGDQTHWNLTRSCCYQATNDLKKLCANAAATKHGAESKRGSTCVHVHTRRLLRQPAKSNTASSATQLTQSAVAQPPTGQWGASYSTHQQGPDHIWLSSNWLTSCWPASHLH